MIKNCLSKPYHTKLWRAIYEYELIEPGDRILIGLSGGKDSMFLTYALNTIRSYSDIRLRLGSHCGQVFRPLGIDRVREACGHGSHSSSPAYEDRAGD